MSDRDLRDLERRVRRGDPNAATALERACARAGVPNRPLDPLPSGMRLAPPNRHPRTGVEIPTYVYALPVGEIEMVYVPPGDFMMGEDGGDEDEGPRHEHAMPQGFFIARTPTTWGIYLDFVRSVGGAQPWALPWTMGAAPDEDAHEARRQPRWWNERLSHPAIRLRFEEATAFAEWAGLVLPSEAEWEKAARGVDGRRYSWGDQKPSSAVCRWHRRAPSTFAESALTTVSVESFEQGASPYGVVDMGSGNVQEWCSDWHDGGAYERYARGDYAPPKGTYRVGRGGEWGSSARSFTTYARQPLSVSRRAYPGLYVGFRTVRRLEGAR